MKAFLSGLAWVLFLLLAVVFLLFYNFAYLPRADRVVRQQNEIAMWTGQVQQLSDSLKALEASWDTAFSAYLTFDELFGGGDNLQLTQSAEASLRSYVPTLQGLAGFVEVIGHTNSGPVPAKLKDKYPSNWEYGAACAGTVARALISWGVLPSRVRVVSSADTRPAGDYLSAPGRADGRLVEILVRNR
jgi:outer membrane protein OmpA-like peptidoglycan-associated protein